MFYCVFLDGHLQTRPSRREANTYELAAKRGDPMRRTAQSGAIGVGSAKHEIQPKRDPVTREVFSVYHPSSVIFLKAREGNIGVGVERTRGNLLRERESSSNRFTSCQTRFRSRGRPRGRGVVVVAVVVVAWSSSGSRGVVRPVFQKIIICH